MVYHQPMKLWAKLRQLLTRKMTEEDDPYSIVLLLRKPHIFTSDEIQSAGKQAFGISFDGNEDPMYFVVQDSWVTLVKAGKFVLNFLHAGTPYLGDQHEIARQLPREEQRNSWIAHTAWASLAVMNPRREIGKADAYATLANFALFLGDPNCIGIYIPGEQVMMPNDGTAEEGLRMLVRREMFR